MCLAIPGKVVAIDRGSFPLIGYVSYGGIQKCVCFDLTPDVKEGEYVIVHVGFAISKLEENEANKVFDYLQSLGETIDIQ